ncbi:hypothetical protein ACIRU3_47675 [Streptomyces sp. NPDC101151]|uniref:hypothetical protein n=1 Tax=Streptomyces sp. NPDC101151 TaxID=3366115 RepID=UPI00382A6B21
MVKPYAAKGAAQKVSGDVNTCGKAAGTIAKTITTSVSNTVTTTDGTSTSIGANIQLSSAVMLTVNTETNHQYSTSSTTATTESTTYTLAAPANMISYMQFRPYIIYSKGHIVAHYQYPTHGSTTWTSGVVTSVIPMTLGDGSLDGEFTVISRSC